MSIIRNSASPEDLNLKVVRLSSLPYGGIDRNIKEYVRLQATGYILNHYSNDIFSTVLRCEIPADTSGYLFGIVSSNTASGNYFVKVEDNTIKWYLGSSVTPVATHAVEEGWHDLGFAGGVAVYDYKKVGTAQAATSNIHSKKMTIGGATLSDNTHSYYSDFKLYRFDVTVYPSSTPTSRSSYNIESFYPVGAGMFINARKLPQLTIVNESTGTATDSTDNITYGVQASDMREITGSPFRDLLGIITDDGGVAKNVGWKDVTASERNADYPQVFSKTGATRKFAFYGGNSSSSLPHPDGYTPSKQGSTDYELGELIRGRQPKWSIWNDCIKFGKYATQATSGAIRIMKFNIRKDNNGSLVGYKPEMFENYDCGKNYRPFFELLSQIMMEWHNGVPCRMNNSNLLCGDPNQYPDAQCVFAMSKESGGLNNVRLGNLPLWNYTINEQMVHTGIELMQSIGGGLLLKVNNGGEWVFMASMLKTSADTDDYDTDDRPKTLSSESSQATKNMFKYKGFDCSSFMRDQATGYMRDELSHYGKRKIKASLVLTTSTDYQPAAYDLVDCSSLVPDREGLVIGMFDIRNSNIHVSEGTDDDRFIIGEHGGIANIGSDEYLIGVEGENPQSNWGLYSTLVQKDNLSSPYGKGIAIAFGLKETDSNTIPDLLGSSQDKKSVFAFMQVVSEYKTQTQTTIANIDAFEQDVTLQPMVFNNLTIESQMAVFNGNYDTSKDGDVTTYNVYSDYSASKEIRSTTQLTLFLVGGTQVCLLFDLCNVTNSQGDPNIIITVTSANGTTTVNVTVHQLYNMEGATALTVTSTTGRSIQGKYFGFSKALVAGDENNTDYLFPFWYDVRFRQARLQPWDLSANVNKLAGALFMWKDLMQVTDVNQDRPTKTVGSGASEHEEILPITCHMRVFGAADGPHTFNLKAGHKIDTYSENPYQDITFNNIDTRIYCHNAGTLIMANSSPKNYIDAMLSMWRDVPQGEVYTDNDQIADSTSMNGKTIIVYAENIHEPKDTVTISEIARFSIPATGQSGAFTPDSGDNPPSQEKTFTTGDYLCDVTTRFQWGAYSTFPTSTVRTGAFGNKGFFRLQIRNGVTDPTPGTIYHFEIINTPT